MCAMTKDNDSNNGSLLNNGSSEQQPLSRWENVVQFIMHRFRFLFVVPFLLPIGVLYKWFFEVRNWVVFNANSAPRAHDRKVKLIQNQIKDWIEGGRKTKLCTARSGWQTMSFRYPLYKRTMTQIRTDTLIDILEINEEESYIRVEPMVTMGQITRFLIPRGLTLPIVPELDDLTVGGMINGCGVESSGRKYGMFQHILISLEVVTGDGELVEAKKSTNSSDTSGNNRHALFFGIPWSHGTLGFLTAATIRIIKCRPYVKLTYIPTNTLKEMSEVLTEEAGKDENEFVEGLMFSKEKGCVMRGRFSNGPIDQLGVINSIGYWYKKWFYTYVEDIANKNKEVIEYIPLRDYYHRHSRSIFWELKEIVPFGNNVIFRWFFGWMCPPKISLLKATTTSTLRKLYDRQHVLQDMLVPLDTLEETINVFHDEVEIYPIWLCPFVLPLSPGLLMHKFPKDTNKPFVDVGAYGITTKKSYHPVETTRRLEAFVRSVKGFQMLYADTYMTRTEFWDMFDSSIYHWLRTTFNADSAFPEVYDKVCKAARY